VKIAWVEGVEINLLSVVAGLDLRRPALKLPGFGQIDLTASTATANVTSDAAQGDSQRRAAGGS
jgi:hypothetical protein